MWFSFTLVETVVIGGILDGFLWCFGLFGSLIIGQLPVKE
jgi:hypothetical protein